MRAFTEQSVVLDATNFLSGKLYDFFMFDNAGTPTLGYGPAWTNLTTRAAAIARAQGIWTNSASITLRTNSSTTFTIGANAATYVGTAYGTANGQTGMNFNPAPAGGGTANILGIFNTYNRVPMMAWSRDNTANWTYNSTVWRAANGNANNSISFIDGLGEVNIQPIYSVAVNVSGQAVAVGINLNSTSATPAIQGVANTTTAGSVIANALILPALGYNTLTAMEASTAANAVIYGSGFFSPAGQAQYLQLNVAI